MKTRTVHKLNPGIVRQAVARRLLLPLAMLTLGAAPASAQPGRASSVSVSPVVVRNVTSRQTFIGTVTPTRRVVVGSAVGGRVQDVFVDDGDAVKMARQPQLVDGQMKEVETGEPLAQLRVKTVNIQIAAMRAELNLANQELLQLETSLPEEIAQAKAKLLGAEAIKKFVKTRHDRINTLYERGSTASKDQLDEALSQWVAAEQRFLGAQSELNTINLTREVRLAQAASRVLIKQEEVNRLEDMRSKYTIRAPFEGVVVTKHTEVGAWISSGDPIAEVIELDPVEITIAVPEIHIARLQSAMVGDSAAPVIGVQLDAFPKQKFSCTFHRVVPQADIRSRTFPVQVRLENPRGKSGHLLKPGMLARVTLPVGMQRSVMLVPKDALVLGGRQPVVYAVTKTGDSAVARLVTVETGQSIGSLIEVTGELKAGEQVVVAGNERLRPGPVKILKEIPAE